MPFRLAALVLAICALALPPAATAGEPAEVNSLGLSATYDVDATFGWTDRRVAVTTTAIVTNTVPWTVSTLAFNLATLRTGRARLGEVTVDGSPVAATSHDQTLHVLLDVPLQPGARVTVHIEYSARLAASSVPNADDWSFARIDDVLTAYRWIPWLSRTTPFDRPSVGEPFVTANSPHVRVTITSDRALIFATSGTRRGASGAEAAVSAEFVATNVRDFNFAASPSYLTQSAVVLGTTITLFYRNLPADTVLDSATRAFREYSQKVGPYTGTAVSIAEIGPWAPYESPAHFWLPERAPARLLPWMVAHEMAHQWFHSTVGNDQAREPFADEAIADFMARDHLSRFVPSQCRVGNLDQTIYDLGECYPWVIYVQGVDYLRSHRDRIGDGRFWRAVASYYKAYRFRIGGTRALLAALFSDTAGRSSLDVERFPRLFAPIVLCLPVGRL